jgi:predicted TIM-barrel fold metal-dependent hydrolase
MDLLHGGVFSKFPKLQIGLVEAHTAWLPGWLASLDEHWDRAKSSHKDLQQWPDKGELSPTELFRRQGFIVSFPDDNWVDKTIDFVGENNVLVCTDYPHPQTRYNMLNKFQESYPDLSDDVRRKVLGENAKRIFNLDI